MSGPDIAALGANLTLALSRVDSKIEGAQDELDEAYLALAAGFADAHRFDDAVGVAREHVELRRRPARKKQTEDLARLALALGSQDAVISRAPGTFAGRAAQDAAVARELVEVCEVLATRVPDTHGLPLARALYRLAVCQLAEDKPKVALKTLERAVSSARTAAAPAVVADALTLTVSTLLAQDPRGLPADAPALADEAVELAIGLVADDLAPYAGLLARAVVAQHAVLLRQSRLDEAVTLTGDALEVAREACALGSTGFDADLAVLMDARARGLVLAGLMDDLTEAREAVRTDLAASLPADRLPVVLAAAPR
jgi:tetratricopeptide (TPR) repeat protein